MINKYNCHFYRVNAEQRRLVNEVEQLKVNGNDTISSNNTSLNTTVPSAWSFDSFFTSDYTVVYYSIIFSITLAVIFSRSFSLYHWCVTAATRMHNTMFNNIVYSPMRFFNTNPAGRILNRFSRDVGALDEVLPMTLLDTIQVRL